MAQRPPKGKDYGGNYGPYKDWVNEDGISYEERQYRKREAKEWVKEDRRAKVKETDSAEEARRKREEAERNQPTQKPSSGSFTSNTPRTSPTKNNQSKGFPDVSYEEIMNSNTRPLREESWLEKIGGWVNPIRRPIAGTTQEQTERIAYKFNVTASEVNGFVSRYPNKGLGAFQQFVDTWANLDQKMIKAGYRFDGQGSENAIYDYLLNSGALESPEAMTRAVDVYDKAVQYSRSGKYMIGDKSVTDLPTILRNLAKTDAVKNPLGPKNLQENIDKGDPFRQEESDDIINRGEVGTATKRDNLTDDLLDVAIKRLGQADEEREELKEKADEQFKLAREDRKRQLGIEEDTLKKFENRVRELRAERNQRLQNYEISRRQAMIDRDDRRSLMNDIKNAPSTFEEAQRQGHEKALQNASALASVLPTSQGGGVINQLMNQARQQDLDVASASAVGRLQEVEGRRKQLGDLIAQNQQASQQQQGIDQAHMADSLNAMKNEMAMSQLPLSIAGRAQSNYQVNEARALDTYKTGLGALLGASGMGGSAVGTSIDLSKYFDDKQQQEFANNMAILNSIMGGAGTILSGVSSLTPTGAVANAVKK